MKKSNTEHGFDAYYTEDGAYICAASEVGLLTWFKNEGIVPERIDPDHKVASIGWSEQNQKWYGWSHRAMGMFKIGSKVSRGDCAYVPTDLQDAIDVSIEFFHDPTCHASTEYVGLEEDDRGRTRILLKHTYSDQVPNQSLAGTSMVFPCYLPEFGRGEWTAKTNEDARQMACDFAEGVA